MNVFSIRSVIMAELTEAPSFLSTRQKSSCVMGRENVSFCVAATIEAPISSLTHSARPSSEFMSLRKTHSWPKELDRTPIGYTFRIVRSCEKEWQGTFISLYQIVGEGASLVYYKSREGWHSSKDIELESTPSWHRKNNQATR